MPVLIFLGRRKGSDCLMGKKHLNKNARFKCGSGNAVWFSPQNGDLKVKINGADVLLSDCRLSLIGAPRPGQCNLVPDPTTGAPGMCTAAIISGSWNNNTKMKIGGKGVLNSGCSICCPVGGSITPFKPTFMAITVDDAATTQKVNIAPINSEGCSVLGTNQETSSISENGSNNDVNNSDDTVELKEKGASTSNEQTQEETESVQEVEYALCDYKNCSKAKECEYLKAAHTLKETNESKNASVLKFNMGKDTFDLYAGDCAAIATSLFGSYMYSVAHHHIIPANQCFKAFAEIVKLANYYKYDINKAENGISLPTMNSGYDKQPFELRKKISFQAMSVLRRQWHKGGHKYSCKISAEVDSVLSRPFRHYKDAVDQELTSFSIKLNDNLRCRSDNYDQQAADFIRTMDHICERIAKKLRHFEDNPKKSYPCFISKLAFYYAFVEELTGYEDELFGKDG